MFWELYEWGKHIRLSNNHARLLSQRISTPPNLNPPVQVLEALVVVFGPHLQPTL